MRIDINTKILTQLVKDNLLESIIDAIDDVKGNDIVTIDMTELEERVCDYFVVVTGNSNTQVNAIEDNVEHKVRQNLKISPVAVEGRINGEWVAMDYGYVMVHIFQREAREFYDIEHLWEDAKIIKKE